MGCKVFEVLFWVYSISCLALFARGFTPADNYLIDCESPTNTNVGDRVFMPDKLASKLLSSPETVLGNTSKSVTSDDDSSLYQTARIFTGVSKYTFSISRRGRHWIRLYFYPFVHASYNTSMANFDVSTDNHVLLSSFSVQSLMVKEFSVNVTSPIALPSHSALHRIHLLLANVAGTRDGSSGEYGGSTVSFKNDTLWRTWVPDQRFLVGKNLALSVSNIRAVKYVDGSVYGTCTRMNSVNDSTSNFNVTWEFDVDPGFQYLVRFHFCDIVSKALNQMYFNVFIDSSMVVGDPDLSTYLVNVLAAAYYMDYVTESATSNKLQLSIAVLKIGSDRPVQPRTVVWIDPSNLHSAYPDALLNGLEIMKMNNSNGSLSGLGTINSSSSSSKKNVGAIKTKTNGAPEVIKTWVPFSINGGTSHTMGSKYSKGTTVRINSNMSYHVPFLAVQEATNNFDECWVIGIGGFGKVYKGELNDARGLHYLYTGYAKAVIHRDVKSANILLDENLMAKVTDFGLLKTCPELDHTHASTAVKGSFGYLDLLRKTAIG
ncbi:histone H4-like [Hibiscus syriacus]|uniref:Histone H4-like n=1 Tax=Hibiscus syriacus TaxID=106335 RepID=A0A6A2ZBR8_HIBSY|nr:histone H4-like [Hibiscus syriacus]